MECAKLHKKVCYAFCDARVDEQQAVELLPESGVPEMFFEDAVEMREAQYFEATMDGPAKLREPGAKASDEVDGEMEDLAEEPQDDHQATQDETVAMFRTA